MQVLKENVAYLSNYEVLDILEGVKKRKPRNHLATITYESIKYLKVSGCKAQTPEKIKEFMKSIELFKLTKCEKLSLLNLCPKTALEIQLLVEDSEDRLTEEEVESLLEIVAKHLGEPEAIQQEHESMEQ